MGSLRIALAGIVLISHVYPGIFFPRAGVLAVEAFFLVSGFYMQLIVGTYAADGSGWAQRFYASRLLRLLPLYYAVLLGQFAFVVYSGMPGDRLLCQGRAAAIGECLVANLAILGQDVIRFTEFYFGEGRFHFIVYHPDNSAFMARGENFNLVQQSWSLAPELMFYLLVPVLLSRSSKVVGAIAGISLIIKLAVTSAVPEQFHEYNWYFCFFPAELGVFLTGALACRLAAARNAGSAPGRIWPPLAVVLACGYMMLENLCSVWKYGSFLFLGVTALLLPGLFRLSRRSKWDRAAGECSYPLYMTHVLIANLLVYAGVKAHFALMLGTCLVSVLTAMAYIRWIDEPLTRFRHIHLRDAHRRTAVNPTPSGK